MRLVLAISSARMSVGRVSRGSMTSSMRAAPAGHRLVPAHLQRPSAPTGEVSGVLLHVHRQRVCPVLSSAHVLMPVSGGEPLSSVSMVATSLR